MREIKKINVQAFCIHKISNHDGKRKYIADSQYGAGHAIGKMQLVKYFVESNINYLEYEIFEEFSCLRNQGIMTKELLKYFKRIKKYGYTKLLAVVKKDNIPSIKILNKVGFTKLKEYDDAFLYLRDLEINVIIQNKLVMDFLCVGRDND